MAQELLFACILPGMLDVCGCVPYQRHYESDCEGGVQHYALLDKQKLVVFAVQ